MCWEDPLEEGVATHSSILAWRIPMDRGTWQATDHGVAKSQTQLSDYTQHTVHLPWRDGAICWILVFWMLNFRPAFSFSSFTLNKRVFSSISLFPIRVVSSAYLKLLLFLPAIMIPACDYARLAFPMMYSAYKLNKQSSDLQLWRAPFPILYQSIVSYLVLTVASWPSGF